MSSRPAWTMHQDPASPTPNKVRKRGGKRKDRGRKEREMEESRESRHGLVRDAEVGELLSMWFSDFREAGSAEGKESVEPGTELRPQAQAAAPSWEGKGSLRRSRGAFWWPARFVRYLQVADL